MRYHVTLEDREYLIEVEGETVSVNGVGHRAELREVPGTPLTLLMLDGRSHVLAARPLPGGRWDLLHRGEVVVAEVLDERRRHIRAVVGQGRVHPGVGVVTAPMPGLVVRVLAAEGETVGPGSGLIVLEAMKMENELKAPGPGVVRRVLVRPGQAVEKGEALAELEAP